MNFFSKKYVILKLSELRPHEEVQEALLSKLIQDIETSKHLIRPIAVDQKTKVILDGHHRVAALRRLGWDYVPAYEFNYQDNSIKVLQTREGRSVNKKEIIAAGLKGSIYPPKSTRHMVTLNGISTHISEVEKENPTLLKDLKRDH